MPAKGRGAICLGIHGKAYWLILCAMLSLIPSAASAICLGSPYPDVENVALQLTQGAKPSELATQDAWTPKSPSDASRHAAWLALAHAFSAAEGGGATPSLGDLERQVRQAAGESDPQLLLALAIYRANTLEGARQLSHETSTIYTVLKISVGWGRRSFKRLSMTDALTGLLNRRWAEKLTSAISSDRRARTVAALLDIDHFKLVNDCHGHASGDDVLKVFAGILKAKFRKGDIVARWGGEEFLVILRNCTVADACSLVAAARQSARELPWPNMPGYTLCFSAGIAAWPLKATLSEVVGNADTALYNAKEQGRDRTCLADHMPVCG